MGTDDQFIKAHAAARYTLNSRATEILDGKMRDGILATLREKVGGPASLLAARLAELEGRDTTFTGQAIVNAEFDKLRNAQLTSANPLRKPDGSVMTLILLAGSTASAVDSYFLDSYPDRETAASERDKFAFFRARPQPPTLAQMAVYRARPLNGIAFTAPYGHNGVWPTLESVLFPETRPESFWVGHSEFDPVRGGSRHQEGRSDLRRAEPPSHVLQGDHDGAPARHGRQWQQPERSRRCPLLRRAGTHTRGEARDHRIPEVDLKDATSAANHRPTGQPRPQAVSDDVAPKPHRRPCAAG